MGVATPVTRPERAARWCVALMSRPTTALPGPACRATRSSPTSRRAPPRRPRAAGRRAGCCPLPASWRRAAARTRLDGSMPIRCIREFGFIAPIALTPAGVGRVLRGAVVGGLRGVGAVGHGGWLPRTANFSSSTDTRWPTVRSSPCPRRTSPRAPGSTRMPCTGSRRCSSTCCATRRPRVGVAFDVSRKTFRAAEYPGTRRGARRRPSSRARSRCCTRGARYAAHPARRHRGVRGGRRHRHADPPRGRAGPRGRHLHG